MTEQFIADFKKPGKEILIDLINWCNRSNMTTVLTPNQVFFSKPKPSTELGYNTTIEIAKVIGFHIPQETNKIYYNRLDINQLVKKLGFNQVLYYDFTKPFNSTHDLIPILREKTGIHFLNEDIVFELVDIDFKTIMNKHRELMLKHNESYEDLVDEYFKDLAWPKVTIRMAEESIAYIGEFEIEIRPKPINIDTAIRVRYLKPFMPLAGHGLG